MGRSERAEALSEAALAEAWEHRSYAPGPLVDDADRHLTVVFPGRRWGGPGPDFRGAVLALADGTLVRGDVEVHRRASSWRTHGHAVDRAYDGVVLHVVETLDAPACTRNGQRVPALVVRPLVPIHLRPVPRPCLDARDVLELVEEAGRQRFAARARRFTGDLACQPADQVVWRGVAEALGYSRNTEPFGRLADAVPWTEARAVLRTAGVDALTALLLGSAGLLPAATLPEAAAWDRLAAQRGARPWLSPLAWDPRQSRPGNHPARRLRGLALLGQRWLAAGNVPLLDQVLAAVRGDVRALWGFAAAPPWIGPDRARLVAVNVLLPLAEAAGCAAAAEVYARVPGEPLSRPLRYMAAQLGAPPRYFRTACQRQGLLHLFKTRCAERLCHACPVAQERDVLAV